MKTKRYSVVLLAFAASHWSVSICQPTGDCGYVFLPEATSGVIHSPNYPFDYRSPAFCQYTFLPASANDTVRLCFEFRRFDLDAGRYDLDYLEFPSGHRYCEQGRLCVGKQDRANVPSTVWKDNFCWQMTDPGRPLLLTFRVRSGNSSSGFFAYYKQWPYTDLGHVDCEILSLQHHHDAADPEERCVIQCPDGSQCDLVSDPECSCPGVVPCDPGQFTCFNRKCIARSLMCDKMDNCGDGSDETYMHARCQSRDLLSINLLSCDFELDICGFLGLRSWKPDSRYYLGPFEDHTVGPGGHYLRTDFTDQVPGKKISFFSQTLKSFPVEGLCLSFWYYSLDDNRGANDIGGENDDLLLVRFGKTVIWRTNSPRQAWHSAHAYITREDGLHQSQTKFQFEVTRGRGRITLVALDDIVLYKGHCYQDLEPSCTFEQHSCGWTQNYGEEEELINKTPRWHLHSNASIGHGRFLYLAFTSPPSTIDYSTLSLTSPYITSTKRSQYCIDLRLYTSSYSVTVELRLVTRPGGERPVWNNRDNGTIGWSRVAVTVSAGRVFRIVLGILSAEYCDSVAVDNVTISRGQCYNHNGTILINTTLSTSVTVPSSVTTSLYGCGPDEHLCHKNNICLKDDRWCNGFNDCPDGEDEDIDFCRDHQTDADSARRRPMSVLTILVVTSVVFLLVLVLVTLVWFCLTSPLKRRHRPQVTSSAGRPPAAADPEPGIHAGIPKYRADCAATRTNECFSLKPIGVSRRIASSIDSNPYAVPSRPFYVGLSSQSGYLDPPPSYAASLCLGATFPDSVTPNEGCQRPVYTLGDVGDVTSA